MDSRNARGRRLLGLLLVTGAILGATSSRASAATEHYCGGASLPAGWSCAGANAHTGSLYVEITTDHTGCSAVALGYGGYNSAPTGSDTFSVACTTGAGTTGGTVAAGGTAYHGAVFNPNASTADFITDAHITW